MDTLIAKRQQLIEAIQYLPSEALLELVDFVEYLRYKSTRTVSVSESQATKSSEAAFLLSIAGIGSSVEDDLAERDEEILANEIDPIHGWSVKTENKA